LGKLCQFRYASDVCVPTQQGLRLLRSGPWRRGEARIYTATVSAVGRRSGAYSSVLESLESGSS
jgi:hypothetical protein